MDFFFFFTSNIGTDNREMSVFAVLAVETPNLSRFAVRLGVGRRHGQFWPFSEDAHTV